MKSNKDLVEYLEKSGYITRDDIKRAFLFVDRKDFVPKEFSSYAYEDEPIPIPELQTTSAPSVIAKMLEMSEIKKGQKVLEIGTGSGYLTALLAYLVGDNGIVVSMEIFEKVYEFARRNLSKYNFRNIKLVLGDGTLGYPEMAPYDVIICGAAAPYHVPKSWIDQLKINGIIVTPRQLGFTQWIYKLRKLPDESIKEEDKWGPVIFVPLKGKYGARS